MACSKPFNASVTARRYIRSGEVFRENAAAKVGL